MPLKSRSTLDRESRALRTVSKRNETTTTKKEGKEQQQQGESVRRRRKEYGFEMRSLLNVLGCHAIVGVNGQRHVGLFDNLLVFELHNERALWRVNAHGALETRWATAAA